MNINEKVNTIKTNEKDRNLFIKNHMSFVIGKVTKITGRYINKETDDAFIIGLEAFDEAITKFDSEKGNFLPFADLVIRSKVTDWLRKKQKETLTVELDDQIEDKSRIEDEIILKDEVFRLKNELAQFEITFDDLVEKAPKKAKTKKKVTAIGVKASMSTSIVMKMFKMKALPMKDIQSFVDTTLRIIKTHRDFIISVIVIKAKHFDLVEKFLIDTEEG